jgi:hypothetical protein
MTAEILSRGGAAAETPPNHDTRALLIAATPVGLILGAWLLRTPIWASRTTARSTCCSR